MFGALNQSQNFLSGLVPVAPRFALCLQNAISLNAFINLPIES